MKLSLLLLAGMAATVSASRGHCSSCNLTRKGEIRTAEILNTIKAQIGFDPKEMRKISDDVRAKGAALAHRIKVQSENKKDELETFDSITVFGSEDVDEDSNIARFHFRNDTKGRAVDHADLHLYLAKPSETSEERRAVSITVHEANEDGEKGELLASHRVLTPDHGHAPHRLRLNAQSMERIGQSHTASLIVEAVVDGENLVVLPGDDDANAHAMNLDLVLSRPRRRTRRDDRLCEMQKKIITTCCRYSIPINLVELGWDFIIAPEKFLATGCAGECATNKVPVVPTEPSREAITEMLGYHDGGCCHPIAYENQDMFYVTPTGNFARISIKDAYVSACSCA